MKKSIDWFTYIAKSVFVRSVFMRILAIFIVVSISIAAISFYSVTTEIRKNILAERLEQLRAVERTISERMAEITSIAYNVGQDPVFFLEPVDDSPGAGYEMSKTLGRYLVGNNFIEHLAYYRTAEPDTIYISSGQRSLSEFFSTSFGMDEESISYIIEHIQKETHTVVTLYGNGDNSYFAYLYPLPQPSSTPLAHVLAMIPVSEVEPLMSTLLINSNGAMAVFDGSGREIYRLGETEDALPMNEFVKNGSEEETGISASGQKYVVQRVVSKTNGWVYISAIRQSDTLSGVANKQITFTILLLLLLAAAIAAMLASIIKQYKPISRLARQVSAGERGDTGIVDERILLSNTIATLRSSSEQKQKYETAYYEAEAASKAKSAFLSSMSHDIRTPMNAIIGMTELALKHEDEPDYVHECLSKVKVSSAYLLDIINNVLDMSRIESGRIPLTAEPMYLPELINSVVWLVAPSVSEKKQTLEVDMDGIERPAVIGDSIRLTQVFVNILSNAVKFTPEGGSLSFKAFARETSDDGSGSYAFVFSDTGIGMAPEFVSHVFDTFARAKGVDSSGTEGTGLGMAIAKNLVELMGGTISCESLLGRGTTFTVTMPLRFASEAEAAKLAAAFESGQAEKPDAEPSMVDLKGKHILLVEDNALNREIALKIIGETGADITQAQNGREAVDAFTEKPSGFFDLILMDIQMPVMNGYEATAEIRSSDRPDARTVQIFAMTANTFDEDVRQVIAAGMNGHIGKPYNPEQLLRVLAQALRKQEKNDTEE